MYPERIVCLGAEFPDILDRLGVLDRVVGISAYTEGPPDALKIPKVSGFRHGNVQRILERRPDLVLLTSTVQTRLADALAGHGVPLLHLYPHRFHDMIQSVRLLGNVVNRPDAAESLIAGWEEEVAKLVSVARRKSFRPRVYFEEWMDPLICGTGWVSDLVEMAGGVDIFAERSRAGKRALERVVTSEAVLAQDPDLILVSWCGKPMRKDEILARPGWDRIRAVQADAIVEIPFTILQCGPTLLDNLRTLPKILSQVEPR